MVGLEWLFLFCMIGFALSTCDCPDIAQNVVYESSDLVAKVVFNSVSLNTTLLVYNTTYLEVFKPHSNSTKKPTEFIVADSTNSSCTPVTFIMFDMEYLIGAKRNQNNFEISRCNGFPQHRQGKPTWALPWELVTNKTLTSLRSGKF